MSVGYEVMLVRGCILGKGKNKAFEEYAMNANLTSDQAETLWEKWQDNENLFFNYYQDQSEVVFGYPISQTWDPTEETFTAVPIKTMDIDVEKEHNLEKEFFNAFKVYPPHFSTYMVMRAI